MNRYLATALVFPAALLVACGGSNTESKDATATDAASGAPASSANAASPSQAGSDENAGTVPDTCDKKDNLCLPNPAFVKKLCSSGSPDVALYMFKKGTPFTRGYIAVKSADPVNASGGASSNDEPLVFDEEIIVLTHRVAQAGGIQVSGSGGSLDVLRWDGFCASLQPEEVRFDAPPKPKHPKVDFHGLADATQQALLKDDKIAKTNADRRKECKGVTMGTTSAKCTKLVDQLDELVVDFVRNGGDVPLPAKLP